MSLCFNASSRRNSHRYSLINDTLSAREYCLVPLAATITNALFKYKKRGGVHSNNETVGEITGHAAPEASRC